MKVYNDLVFLKLILGYKIWMILFLILILFFYNIFESDFGIKGECFIILRLVFELELNKLGIFLLVFF